MGLPQINIEFIGKADTVITRSQLGIVALILKDEVQTADTVVYKSFDEVKTNEWSPVNLDYIQKTFIGTPSKVIIERLPASAENYTDALQRLNNNALITWPFQALRTLIQLLLNLGSRKNVWRKRLSKQYYLIP